MKVSEGRDRYNVGPQPGRRPSARPSRPGKTRQRVHAESPVTDRGLLLSMIILLLTPVLEIIDFGIYNVNTFFETCNAVTDIHARSGMSWVSSTS